jgi:hypothetical protein
MTTASTNNSFVKDGHLYIVPTLTSDSISFDSIYDKTVATLKVELQLLQLAVAAPVAVPHESQSDI